MPQRKPRTLVLSGDGLHGDQELASAFELAGFDVDVRTLNELVISRVSQEEFTRRWSAVGFPGGASFGDKMGMFAGAVGKTVGTAAGLAVELPVGVVSGVASGVSEAAAATQPR